MDGLNLELAYLAGFFDGEGSIYITNGVRKINKSFILQINATNNDMRPLLMLQKVFGGSVLHQGTQCSGWRQSYFWQAASNKAEIALRSMLPYLRIKEEQAKLALSFREVQRRHIRGRKAIGFGHGFLPYTEEQMKEKQALREAIHILNTHGVKSSYKP